MRESRSGGRLVGIARRAADFALVAFVGGVLSIVVLAQGLPRLGHHVFVVGGPSMEPTIPLGAAIVTSPIAAADLRSGDVVSMRVGPEQAIFTHRVIRTVVRDGEPWIETKGDANTEPDPAIVPASAVIGRVDAIVPVAGYLISLLSTVTGVLFVIGIAGSLLAAAWLLETFEEDGADAAPATDAGIAPDGRRVVVPRRLLRPRSAAALAAPGRVPGTRHRLGAGVA